MKHVILHADGMADHPRKELGGRTPLQAASTLTWIASRKVGSLGSWPRCLRTCDRGAV